MTTLRFLKTFWFITVAKVVRHFLGANRSIRSDPIEITAPHLALSFWLMNDGFVCLPGASQCWNDSPRVLFAVARPQGWLQVLRIGLKFVTSIESEHRISGSSLPLLFYPTVDQCSSLEGLCLCDKRRAGGKQAFFWLGFGVYIP